MSGDGRWSLGGTAAGDGQTNKVYLKKGFTAEDKAKLCALMCHCQDNPGKSADGRDLRQVCVAKQLKAEDKNYQTSEYKAEQQYNMKPEPPEPIMSPNTPNKPHGWLREWIDKNWEGTYVPGVGNVRIPDVVIVKDPAAIPTQDNLRAVVEMKFDGDTYSDMNEIADLRIAGANAESVLLTPKKCGCKRERKRDVPESATQSAPKAAPWDPLKELEPLGNQTRGIMNPPMTPQPLPGGSAASMLLY